MKIINSQYELIILIIDQLRQDSKKLDLNNLEIHGIINFAEIYTAITNRLSWIMKKKLLAEQLSFTNIIFIQEITFTGENFNNMIFNNVQFLDDVKFERLQCSYFRIQESQFKKECLFSQINITDFLQILLVKFKGQLIINNCEFGRVVDFTVVKFYNQVEFLENKFNGFLCFETVVFSPNYNHRFNDMEFQEVTCCNSYMRNIEFNHCDFQELNVYQVSTQKKVVKEEIQGTWDINGFTYPTRFINTHFNQCTFDKLLLGKTIIQDCTFDKSVIKEEADFHKFPDIVAIPGKIKPNDIKTTIDNTKFINVDFQKEGDFKYVQFKKTVRFERCRFGHRGAFNNCTFNELQFDNIRLADNSHIYFGQTQGKLLQFINTILLGRVDFNTDKINKLNLFGTVIRGTLNRIVFDKFKCENWETACILKHEESIKSNIIESLRYQGYEKTLYMIYTLKKCKLGEFISLLLSFFFHNHGQNWLLAFFWTIVIWIGTFTGFQLGFGQIEYNGEFISDLITYIIPTEYDLLTNKIKNIESLSKKEWIGIVSFISGKIFVPYGIYEVIKAFKKYR